MTYLVDSCYLLVLDIVIVINYNSVSRRNHQMHYLHQSLLYYADYPTVTVYYILINRHITIATVATDPTKTLIRTLVSIIRTA